MAIRFRFLAEEKNKSTGKSKWKSVGVSRDVVIQDISVTTQAHLQVIDYGAYPKIIPFGVKGEGGRSATLTGMFASRSMFPTFMNAPDDILDVLQNEEMLGRGLRLADKESYELLPELGPPPEVTGDSKLSANWKIDQFAWDQQAIKAGQYKFTMTLSYVWDAERNEIQLFADGIGKDIPEFVRFYVKPKSGGTAIYIDNPKINTTLHELNRATFTTANEVGLSENQQIHIYCETAPTDPVFLGIITDINNSSDGSIRYDCLEIGTLLYRKPCAKIRAGMFKPRIRIPNPLEGEYLTLSQMIGAIINLYRGGIIDGYDPGDGTDKTGKWGRETDLPGRPGSKLPSQILSGFTIGKALDNILNDQCGLYTWFDNKFGKLEYGFIRNYIRLDLDKHYILYSEQITSLSQDFKANGVALVDNSGNQPTLYPPGADQGSYIQYKFNSDLTNEQLTSIAQRIYQDMQNDTSTFKVRFPAGTTEFKDGDVFDGLGDSTVSPKMIYRDGPDADPTENPGDSVWQIKEMTITDKYTECTVGSSFFSIFDIYKEALKRYDGLPTPTTQKEIETPSVVPGSSAPSNDDGNDNGDDVDV